MLHGKVLNQNNWPSIDRYYKENDLDDEGNLIEYVKKNVDYIDYRMSLQTTPCVNIAFITDIHIGGSSKKFENGKYYPYYKAQGWSYHNMGDYNANQTGDKFRRALHALRILIRQKKIDCLILGGDYLSQTSYPMKVYSSSVKWAVTTDTTKPSDSSFSDNIPTLKIGDYLWSMSSIVYGYGNSNLELTSSMDSFRNSKSYAVVRIGSTVGVGVPMSYGTVGSYYNSKYLHLAYATSNNGDNFSSTYFEGATHLGYCFNNVWEDINDTNEASPISSYSGWQWIELVNSGTHVAASSTTIQYQYSDSGIDVPNGTWTTTKPSLVNSSTANKVVNGKYIWIKTTTVYSDSQTSVSYCAFRKIYFFNTSSSTSGTAVNIFSMTKDDAVTIMKNIYNDIKQLAYQIPVIICRGNHDANAGGFNSVTFYANSVLKSINLKRDMSDPNYEGYDEISRNLPTYSNIVYGSDEKDYGYIDIVDKKVRIIWMNSWDYCVKSPEDILSCGFIYRQRQLDFLIYKALNFGAYRIDQIPAYIRNENDFIRDESGWSVITFNHYTIDNTTFGFGAPAAFGQAIEKIFIAFRHNLSGGYSWNHSANQDDIYNVDISWDFTNNLSNKYITNIHGHGHTDHRTTVGYGISGNNIDLNASTYNISNIQTTAINSPGATSRRLNYRPVSMPNLMGWLGTYVVGDRESAFDIIQYRLSDSHIFKQRFGFNASLICAPTNKGGYNYSFKDLKVTVLNDNNVAIQGAYVVLVYNGEIVDRNPDKVNSTNYSDMPVAVTDANGEFTFKDVYIDKCLIRVTPPANSGYSAAIKLLTNIAATTVIVKLLPADN